MSQTPSKDTVIELLCSGNSLSLYPNFQADCEVVIPAVFTNGMNLEFAHADLRKEKHVVMAALGRDGNAIAFVDPTLLADNEIILTAANSYLNVHAAKPLAQYMNVEQLNNHELVLQILDTNAQCLWGMPQKYTTDMSLLIPLLTDAPACFKYVDQSLLNNKKLLTAAFSSTNYPDSWKVLRKMIGSDLLQEIKHELKAHAKTDITNNVRIALQTIVQREHSAHVFDVLKAFATESRPAFRSKTKSHPRV